MCAIATLWITASRAQAPVDPTFASNGWYTGGVPNGRAFTADMAIDQNGNIILAGRIGVPPSFGPDSCYIAVTRLNPDGILDTTFAAEGVFSQWVGWIDDVHLGSSPDGGVLVVYDTRGDQGDASVALKLGADGQLDPAFGPDGSGSTGALPTMNPINHLLVLPNGQFLLAGGTPYAYSGIRRYNADGSRDMGFGTDGEMNVYPPNDCRAFTTVPHRLPDGKFLVTGPGIHPLMESPVVNFVARFTPDGSPDAGFADNGLSVFDCTEDPLEVTFTHSAVAPDGTIWLAGMGEEGAGHFRYAIAKVSPDGQLDTSFGNGTGYVLHANGGSFEEPVNDMPMSDFLLLPDGKFMIYSTFLGYNGLYYQCELTRFNQDGSLDATFADQGHMFFLDPYGGISAKMALQADGKLLASGVWYDPGTQQAGFNCVRLNADDATAVTTLPLNDSKELSIWPNPNHDGRLAMTVEVLGEPVARAFMTITDRFGRPVYTSTLTVSGPRINVALDLKSSLAKGVYLVQVTAGEHVFGKRLVLD